VLSDIVMAGSKNGLDLARTIRDTRPRLPVILATGYSEAAAQAVGEFTVLRKPYQSEDLNWAFAVLDERERQSLPPLNVVDFRNGNPVLVEPVAKDFAVLRATAPRVVQCTPARAVA